MAPNCVLDDSRFTSIYQFANGLRNAPDVNWTVDMTASFCIEEGTAAAGPHQLRCIDGILW